VKPVGQSSKGKFRPTLTADAFGHDAGNEITEVRVLMGLRMSSLGSK
jgi:hypothetical protein